MLMTIVSKGTSPARKAPAARWSFGARHISSKSSWSSLRRPRRNLFHVSRYSLMISVKVALLRPMALLADEELPLLGAEREDALGGGEDAEELSLAGRGVAYPRRDEEDVDVCTDEPAERRGHPEKAPAAFERGDLLVVVRLEDVEEDGVCAAGGGGEAGKLHRDGR